MKHDFIGYKILYEYDNLGNLISETEFDREKDTFLLKDKTIYFYNSLNQKIKDEKYNKRMF